MPTGLTCNIKDGQTFREFVLGVLPQFGACYSLRDAPGAEIPEKFEPSTYHKEQLDCDQDDLEALATRCISDCGKQAAKEHTDAMNVWHMGLKDKRKLKIKYDDMLTQIEAWVPPTDDHIELKKFMKNQIIQSIDWDCDASWDLKSKPVCMSGEAWKEERMESLLKSIAYHEEHWNKDVEQAEKNTAWVHAVLDTLK